MMPQFLIVGAMKSGTSTLRDLLADIDGIFIPSGEVHFFSDEAKYSQGLDWYREQFAGANGARIIGEKTATYSYVTECADRIQKDLPEAKLIWIFRNPVSRTYSHYWHSVKNGSERLSFRSAIERESERVAKDMWRGYQTRSLFHRQVENYLRLFPKEQMHFMTFEQLLADPLRELNRLLKFLEVPELSQPPVMRRSNATHIPRSRNIQWLARRLFQKKTRPYDWVNRMNRCRTPGYPQLEQDIRSQLQASFKEPNQHLAELTGLDLSAW